MNPPSITAGLAFVALGGAFLAMAAILFVAQKLRVGKWARAEGEVVGIASGRRLEHEEIRFDAGDRSVVFTSSARRSRAVGDPVAVRFDPASPERACVDAPMELHFRAFVLGVLGLLGAFVGIAMAMLASS